MRKDMMKKKPQSAVQREEIAKPKEPDHPKSQLMSRLASGSKPEISKKEMLKLTNKNYELLPEVMRKREEEKKKEDWKLRQTQIKE